MNKKITLTLTVCCASLVGCATSGPKLSEMQLPALQPSQGRIFIYRTTVAGAAVQPKVRLNNEVVGKATPKGFIYADRPAGNYEITTSTEVKRSLSLALDQGQTRYVRLGMSMGFFVGHVYPELVEPETGEAEISKCRYIGTTPNPQCPEATDGEVQH